MPSSCSLRQARSTGVHGKSRRPPALYEQRQPLGLTPGAMREVVCGKWAFLALAVWGRRAFRAGGYEGCNSLHCWRVFCLHFGLKEGDIEVHVESGGSQEAGGLGTEGDAIFCKDWLPAWMEKAWGPEFLLGRKGF